MRWAKRRSCVVSVVLLFLTGCAGQQFSAVGLIQGAGAGGQGYVVAGSAESTALALETSLKGLGVSAVAAPQGDDIRIASHTPKGDKFALVLTRIQGPQGESTRVRFEWENGPDEQTRTHVMASLNAQSGSSATLAKQ